MRKRRLSVILCQEEKSIEIIPAIDIRGGHCVRLYQGDYDRETVFSEDPLEVALKWQSMGAPRLHVVDLDAAGDSGRNNLEIAKNIARVLQIPTQLGGGVRDMGTLKDLLKAGLDRVVIGTAAVENPRFIEVACHSFRESVIIGIDAWDGCVATHGWKEKTRYLAADFAKLMIKAGARRFVYTDISRDGTLTEPNFTGISEMITAIRFPVIVAGGISSLTHITMLRQLGADGVIVGKALYTGDINLRQALTQNSAS